LIASVVVAAGLVGAPCVALAHDAYDDSQSHPLRIAAYGLHAAGYLVEYVVFRPLHFVVSNPQLEPVFGHGPHESPFGDYAPYEPEEVD
jgi:hypothetical protein